MRRLTEEGEFDARSYFMGQLAGLADRGFEQAHDQNFEAWRFENPPFLIWAYLKHGSGDPTITAELVLRGERTLLNRWDYNSDELDAALAQVDRILPLVTQFAGVPGREDACKQLRAMRKVPMVGEAEEDYDPEGNLMPEPDEPFDAREYLLRDRLVNLVKARGYQQIKETADAFSKLLFSAAGRSHFLTLYGMEFLDDPEAVLVEYQRHDTIIGYSFPWSSRVDKLKLAAVLPTLESAIRSAWDQKMSEPDLKRALDALVKA